MSTEFLNTFTETLKETLDEIEVSQKEVAQSTGIPETHLSQMKHGKRRITAEYDLRLSRYFGTSVGFWLRLQMAADIRQVQSTKGTQIEKEVAPRLIA
jgi:addiction module HigA family antidote